MKQKLLFALFILPLSLIVAQENTNTLLWKISGNGIKKNSYVFGTMHMVCESTYELKPTVLKAMKKSKVVVLEMDITNMAELGKYILKHMYTTDSLSSGLSPIEKDSLRAQLNTYGIVLDDVELMSPLIISTLLTENIKPKCKTKAVEEFIIAVAKEKKQNLDFLETVEEQMTLANKAIDRETLIKSLEVNMDYESQLDEMFTAYENEDLKAIQEMIYSLEVGSEEFIEHLLKERNINWVKEMPEMMERQPTFFAVGAGHLIGEFGLIELLRKSGYEVTPIFEKN